MYNYNANVLEVIDGDTIKLNIDLGFDIWHIINVRLNGINCAEKNTDLGKKAKDFVCTKLLPVGTMVNVTTYKPEKYGRMLADIKLPSDVDTLNKILVDNNLAVAYDGHGPRPVPKG
jgi:micrococcal nuclease